MISATMIRLSSLALTVIGCAALVATVATGTQQDYPPCHGGCSASVTWNITSPNVFDGSCNPNSTTDFGVSVSIVNTSNSPCDHQGSSACVGSCTWLCTMSAYVDPTCAANIPPSAFYLAAFQSNSVCTALNQIFTQAWTTPCSPSYCQVFQHTVQRNCGDCNLQVSYKLQDTGYLPLLENAAVTAHLHCPACN
jgi:hypothetical protein